MYAVIKDIEIAAAHHLNLDYESKCSNLHGHNWKVRVYCKSEELDANGMVVDFSKIKEAAMLLDHDVLNNYIDQPTAENIAKFLCGRIPHCYRVEVRESEGNLAIYEEDET